MVEAIKIAIARFAIFFMVLPPLKINKNTLAKALQLHFCLQNDILAFDAQKQLSANLKNITKKHAFNTFSCQNLT